MILQCGPADKFSDCYTHNTNWTYRLLGMAVLTSQHVAPYVDMQIFFAPDSWNSGVGGGGRLQGFIGSQTGALV